MAICWQSLWIELGLLLSAGSPFEFVDGDTDLAYEVAAYAHDRPRALPNMPPIKPTKLTRDGKVVVCYAGTEVHETLQPKRHENPKAD